MVESLYVTIKELTNRYIPISITFDKICTYIEILQRELEVKINS